MSVKAEVLHVYDSVRFLGTTTRFINDSDWPFFLSLARRVQMQVIVSTFALLDESMET